MSPHAASLKQEVSSEDGILSSLKLRDSGLRCSSSGRGEEETEEDWALAFIHSY